MSKGGATTQQQFYSQAMAQQPTPTQPGFAVGAPMGQPAGQMPYQPFSSFRGQNPFGNQFGPFNPAANQQIGAYRQQVQDWRSMRPEFVQGDQRMDFRQQMQDWRALRPELNMTNSPAPQFTQAQMANAGAQNFIPPGMSQDQLAQSASMQQALQNFASGQTSAQQATSSQSQMGANALGLFKSIFGG